MIIITYMCSGLTAFGALKKLVNISDDDHILIMGLGGVGMMGLQFARSLFNCKILAADIDPNKLQAARGAGADEVYDTSDELSIMKLIEDTSGGVKAAVDFVGAEKTLQYTLDSTKKGGQIVVVGLFGGAFQMPIPMFPLSAKSIGGSFVGNLDETKEMLELVKAGKVDPIPVANREMKEATQTLDDLRDGAITGRIVLQP
jgi:D-arabinose 1-dehydrogenase-like Zn-dependent alcohol dehydrogenase